MRGVEYNWRRSEFPERQFNERHQIGVIAQEVEKVYPEVVDTNKDGFKSVNYPALVAPLIEAVKALYARITGVEAEVNALKIKDATKDREIASVNAKADQLESENDKLKASDKAKAQKIKELEQRLDKIEKSLKSK